MCVCVCERQCLSLCVCVLASECLSTCVSTDIMGTGDMRMGGACEMGMPGCMGDFARTVGQTVIELCAQLYLGALGDKLECASVCVC